MKQFVLIFFVLFLATGSQAQVNLNLEQEAHTSFNGSIVNCNNWLRTQITGQSVKIGDLDIVGDKITVEAVINRVFPYVGTYIYAGDIVSKHTDANDANYLLRPNNAEITTTNGYFLTPPICDIDLNKTYHIALTYDGVTLKFYRNGFLLSQKPATGNLVQNDLVTTIADYANNSITFGTNFQGYTNEVRIWNVARTQLQLQTYMSSSLPSPTTQSGLVAYYTFDNLTNKQGNSSWNGILAGAASINNTNPSCSFVADSCAILTNGISNIINDYTPVLALNPCNNAITVEDGGAFNAGDTVLMIQMKGAEIDQTNTISFGTVTNYKNAGNYEFNYVKSRTGNVIELKNVLTRPYDIPGGVVQLVRVPYYNSAKVTGTLTCLPWDGKKGGILVLNAKDTIDLLANINVSGTGFAGGTGFNSNNPVLTCNENNYIYPSTSANLAGLKGESIVTLPNTMVRGKGAPASGGGGGQGHNSGGGGGSNAGSGGLGGYQLDNCGGGPFQNRGNGGNPLMYNSAANKIFLGGGGGAGNADNPGNIAPSGGNGGGMVILNAGYLRSNGFKVIANGDNGLACSIPSSDNCHDGMGGGGAGGTVLLHVNTLIDNAVFERKGGKGADMVGDVPAAGRVGAGGGGGGGLLFLKAASLPGTVTSIHTGGLNGVLTQDANNAYGATAGAAGSNIFNLALPFDNTPFKPNIDSVRFTSSSTNCTSFNFNGQGYTQGNPIVSWNWNFGDGNTANTQNTSHTYSGAGTFNVTLVVTDVNGCKDSIIKPVTSSTISVDAGSNISFCSNGPVTHQLNGTTTGTGYSWTPAGFLNNNTLQNPIATISSTTKFYLTVSNASGCTAIDSVTITVNPVPVVSTIGNTSVCKGDSIQLITNSTAQTNSWSPALSVSNPTIANPYFTDTVTQQMIITGTNASGCFAKDTVVITVKPKPIVHSIGDSTTCGPQLITLTTSGAQTYSWSPATNISNPNIASPVFNGTNVQLYNYIVTGTAANGCTAKDTVNIRINAQPVVSTIGNTSVCKGDSIQLITNSTAQTNSWSPALSVNNPTIANPYFTDTVSQQMIITGTNATGCVAKDTVVITVKPKPIVRSIGDSTTCGPQLITLTTSGAQTYSWSPATNISNPNIASPVFNGTNVQLYNYIVTGTAANGCTAKDTVNIRINAQPVVSTIGNTSVCKGDSIQLITNSTAQTNSWSPALSVNNPTIANPYFTDTVTQQMIITGTNASGCFAKDTVVITVKPKPIVRSIGDSTTCGPQLITLTTSGAQTYSWSPATNISNPNIASPVFNGTNVQLYNYIVTGTAANGCTAKDTVNIRINAQPVVSTIGNTSVCKGDSIQLVTNSTAQTNSWSPALSVNNPTISNPYFTDTVSQQMIITGTNATGCVAKDTVVITVKPKPIVRTIGDSTTCGPQLITLTTSGAQTYSWSPATNISNPNIASPVFNGTNVQLYNYIVTGTAANGCTAKDTVNIRINAQPVVSTIGNTSVCKGDSIQLVTNSTAQTNSWSPALSVNNPTIANPYFTDTVSQQMIITGTNASGCFAKDTVVITVKPKPIVRSIGDSTTCGPQLITLTTNGAQTYSWSPATNISNPNIASPVFNGTNVQLYNYYVTGTAANGCTAKDTVNIRINAQPVVSAIGNTSVCKGDSIQLITNSTAQTNNWTPALSVSNPTIVNPYFTDTVSQQMIITGSNASGCFAKDTVVITVKPKPIVRSIGDSTTCGPQLITLTTSGAQTYSWSPATNISNPNIASPVFNGTNVQLYNYYVTGTAANGCTAKDTVNIRINAQPVVSTIGNNSVCKGDSIQLITNSTAQTNSWSPALSVSNPTIVNPYFTDTVSQQMIITGSNATGCVAKDTVVITVKPKPLVKTIENVNTCATNTVTLFTTGAQTYSWTPGTNLSSTTATNPVFTGLGTYTYYVTGTAANGCIGKDSVIISIGNKPTFSAPDSKTICKKDSVQLDGNNGSAYAYSWSPGSSLTNASILNPIAYPQVTTTYTLKVSDAVCLYDSTFLVRVIVNPIPAVKATRSKDIDCSNPSSNLTASGASVYQWIPLTGLNDQSIANPVASPSSTTLYIVTGTDVNGCKAKDSVRVYVKGGQYYGFNIPNAFTPNGDTKNDCFGVSYWGTADQFSLVIYNRWGDKVFETKNLNDCWDGRYKGQLADAGNYVYFLNAYTLCGYVSRKGNVLLIR